MSGRSVTYAVDLIMCIDGTGSMGHLIDEVKSSALKFYEKVSAKMQEKSKKIDQLRAKVIVFRDYYEDPADMVMQCSTFFNLPDQATEFSSFISTIEADGGGDEPENGLEAVALALKSAWTKGDFNRQRYVTIVYTDASAHPLETSKSKPSYYPQDIPKTIDALTDYWQEIPVSAKRLLLFAPDAEPWTMMGSNWNNAIHYVSTAGNGLEDVEMDQILDAIANSV